MTPYYPTLRSSYLKADILLKRSLEIDRNPLTLRPLDARAHRRSTETMALLDGSAAGDMGIPEPARGLGRLDRARNPERTADRATERVEHRARLAQHVKRAGMRKAIPLLQDRKSTRLNSRH